MSPDLVPAMLVASAAVAASAPPARSPLPTVERRSVVWWLLAVTVAGAAALAGPARLGSWLAVGVGTGWGVHRLWHLHLAGRELQATRARVLECCEAIAAELAAGQPPGVGLDAAADIWPVLAPVAQTYHYSGDVPASLHSAGERAGAEGLALVAAAWQVSHTTGYGLADALTRVASTLRESRATERVVAGELASARATARLVSALPLVALAIGSGAGGHPIAFLVGSPLGLACLAGGLAVDLAGLAWIERIAADAQP